MFEKDKESKKADCDPMFDVDSAEETFSFAVWTGLLTSNPDFETIPGRAGAIHNKTIFFILVAFSLLGGAFRIFRQVSISFIGFVRGQLSFGESEIRVFV